MVPWLRIHLPTQGTPGQVQFLVWEDPTRPRTTKSGRHGCEVQALQALLKPAPEPAPRTKRLKPAPWTKRLKPAPEPPPRTKRSRCAGRSARCSKGPAQRKEINIVLKKERLLIKYTIFTGCRTKCDHLNKVGTPQ